MEEIHELKIIKKKYGEKMMHYCREYFPTILNIPRKLLDILNSHFYNVRNTLYDDITKGKKEEDFNNYVYKCAGLKNEYDIRNTSKTPKELLNEAGYNFYECHTVDEVNSFKKYFAPNELLCTFLDPESRLNRIYIFFAIKKNVDEIKREDFNIPVRDDEYGTSVISIQFTIDKYNRLSIKNRYNESVDKPDSTFDNNLDNIIKGLTMSFYKTYGIREIYYENSDLQIENYIVINDEFYKYNYCINNIYYCDNNVIIDNGKVNKFDSEKYIIMDYFIIDLVNKEIRVYDDKIKDTFPTTIGKIKNIEIKRDKDKKIVLITNENNEIFELLLSSNNLLQGIKNDTITKIDDKFLIANTHLKYLEFNNVSLVGNEVLWSNKDLEYLKLDNVLNIGDYFLANNSKLEEINLNNVREIGHDFLKGNRVANKLNMNSLVSIGNSFMSCNNSLKTIILPNLKSTGKCFLRLDEKASFVSLPNLVNAGDYFLTGAKALEQIDADNLEIAGDDFLTYNNKLKYLSLPNLNKAGKMFLSANKVINNLYLPKLNYLPKYFLRYALEIEDITLPEDYTYDSIYNKQLRELLTKEKGKRL